MIRDIAWTLKKYTTGSVANLFLNHGQLSRGHPRNPHFKKRPAYALLHQILRWVF